MVKTKGRDNITVQSTICSHFDEKSICAVDVEIIHNSTKALLHQQSRILYVIEGHAKIMIQSRVYELKKGAFVLILPWEYTEIIEVESPIKYYLIVYNFEILKNVMKNVYNVLNEDISLLNIVSNNNITYVDSKDEILIVNTCKKLIRELGLKSAAVAKTVHDKLNSIYLISLIAELLVYFYRSLNKSKSCTEKSGIEKIEIFHYIYNHLNENIRLRDLSKVFYMSESAISKYIYETVGYSYSELLTNMRVARTINFLLHSYLTLDKVAGVLGYSDASHVSKTFSDQVGFRINDYRRNYGKMNCISKIKENNLKFMIVNYIYNRHDTDLNSHMVAKEFDINVSELNEILKYEVEMQFDEFLNYIRINKACSLLLNTGKLVSDIAYEVGYNNTKTFTRNFNKYKSMAPSEFRKKAYLQSKLL